MFYSAKRQQYLVDQGYTFKVVTDLPEPATSVLDTRAKELDLLNSVLCADYVNEVARFTCRKLFVFAASRLCVAKEVA